MLGRTVYGAALFTCIAGMAADVLAGAALEFYKGKTVRILVGASAGGPLTLGDACLGDNCEELQKIVERLFKLPPAIANKLKEVLK